ncbi:MAG: MdtA/MuxA family multidrug efflux RND transporter periplasmic adaptor subunit [Methylocapsa sp.]|nr:MdtA/MuxA family multidrug efflux RND transporter periplasmic adaptor subunit [Methylocapsa sp.]
MDEWTDRVKLEVAEKARVQDKSPGGPQEKIKLPEGPVKRRIWLRALVVVGLLALLAFAVYRITTAPQTPGSKNTGRSAQEPVAVATIGKGDIRVIVNGLGTVTPIATVTVKTQVNGLLLQVGFEEGQTVKKGDFLAQIDPRPFEALKAQLEGQLAHDQGLLDQARTDLARYQTLLKQNSIARQQAEDQAFLVRQYEGSVKADKAQIEAQNLNLIYAHIVSPIDGRIGLRMVDPGNYIQTSDPGLAVVTQMHPISVIFVVPEDEIPPILAAIKGGKAPEVTVFNRANITELSAGKAVSLDSQIDPATGTVKLRADFDNLDDKLFPNQFVNARLLVKTLHETVTVPARAVQYGAPGTFVYVVGANNTVSARAIELGPQDGSMIAVKAGLSGGERVVVDGADRLREGAEVLITSSETAKQAAATESNGIEPKTAKGGKGLPPKTHN